MSYEVWGDNDDDGSVTDERCIEIAQNSFTAGVRVCREMMARFVEQGGDKTTANSIRANWNPNWGNDPGKIDDETYDSIVKFFDCWSHAA